MQEFWPYQACQLCWGTAEMGFLILGCWIGTPQYTVVSHCWADVRATASSHCVLHEQWINLSNKDTLVNSQDQLSTTYSPIISLIRTNILIPSVPTTAAVPLHIHYSPIDLQTNLQLVVQTSVLVIIGILTKCPVLRGLACMSTFSCIVYHVIGLCSGMHITIQGNNFQITCRIKHVAEL